MNFSGYSGSSVGLLLLFWCWMQWHGCLHLLLLWGQRSGLALQLQFYNLWKLEEWNQTNKTTFNGHLGKDAPISWSESHFFLFSLWNLFCFFLLFDASSDEGSGKRSSFPTAADACPFEFIVVIKRVKKFPVPTVQFSPSSCCSV